MAEMLAFVYTVYCYNIRPGRNAFFCSHVGARLWQLWDRDSIAITPVDSLDADAFLQVRGYYGEYSYDLFYGPLPAGEVFLRCYEATKNIPLSEDRLTERSKVAIDSTITFSQLVHNKSFTIYEGDWEDYYAARIEVWFKNKETKEECKLLEKVYRVDGWMRWAYTAIGRQHPKNDRPIKYG